MEVKLALYFDNSFGVIYLFIYLYKRILKYISKKVPPTCMLSYKFFPKNQHVALIYVQADEPTEAELATLQGCSIDPNSCSGTSDTFR